MALLFRLLLISLLVYLVVKLVRDTISGPKKEDQKFNPSDRGRKVAKDVGEYVDFEEINGEGQRAKGKGETTNDERHTGEKSSRISDKERGTRDFR